MSDDLSIKGIRLYESKHKEGDKVTEHHHQIHQILYALDGKGTILLEGKNLEFNQDNGVVIVPYDNHAIFSDSKMTVLVLVFDQTALDGSVRETLLDECFTTSRIMKLNPFAGSEFRQLLRKMLFEQSRGKSLNLLAMKIHLSEVLLVLARSQQSAPVSDANSLRAERLRNYIDTHYFEIMSSNDISAKLGVSNRHVNNIFKEKYSVTPMQYLTEVRMELAKKMLAETEKDIVSICFEVGFETVSTFYRTFKNAVHMSPNKYRKAYKTE
ncbi:AraC-type DNA-binding protein [Paenibacillus sp. 1_12]|uniref:helix-turn-helix domain-containing protein n=1 Tax=Paenibacillus sp. 1_12 TaxID=1566278 RepID=UPI0008F0AED5|nr:AraC family transcriptional regulator [Paenibacillus sp. 1_12]SFM50667.1 AraC-type DNA-binding protein [Paenibacillus sp. 1_12]